MDEQREIAAEEKTSELAPVTSQDLKAAREARGLSLKDVFRATRVSMINLEAVEKGEFHRLPPPVYTKNFIRKYARTVGVDETSILERYERHLRNLNLPPEEPEVQKPWPEANRRYRFLFGSLAAVIVSGILVYGLFLYDQSGRRIPSAKPADTPPAAQEQPAPDIGAPPAAKESGPQNVTAGKTGQPSPATAKESEPQNVTAGKTGQPSPAAATGSLPVTEKKTVPSSTASPVKNHHLVIATRELTWIRITEDRNPPYEALLKPGDRIERMASDHFLIDIGNAGGVSLTYQGKTLENLGTQGQVVHLRLPEKTTDQKKP